MKANLHQHKGAEAEGPSHQASAKGASRLSRSQGHRKGGDPTEMALTGVTGSKGIWMVQDLSGALREGPEQGKEGAPMDQGEERWENRGERE